MEMTDQELTELRAWIAGRGGHCTERDLVRGPAPYRGNIERSEIALQALATAGEGRWESRPPGESGGRPTRVFTLTHCQADEVTTADVPKQLVSREALVGLIDQLESTVHVWRDETSSAIARRPWLKNRPQPLSDSVEQVLESLFVACDTVDVEESAWPLVLAVDLLREEFVRYHEKEAAGAMAEPGIAFWTEYDAVLAARKPPERSQVETPQELVRQKVSFTQIAKMMGWKKEDGSPDITKLHEELLTPGRHFNPEDRPSRRDIAHHRRVAEDWRARCERWTAGKSPPAIENARTKKPVHETVDELITQRVNAKQIAKMKGLTVAEVEERAEQLGVTLDPMMPMTQVSVARKREDGLRRQMQVAHLNTHAELGLDRDARIAAMLRDGVSLSDIRDSLCNAFPTLTLGDVEDVAVMTSQATS